MTTRTKTIRRHENTTWLRCPKDWTAIGVAVGLAFCAVCANAEPEIIVGPGWVYIETDGTTIQASGAINYSSTNAAQVFQAAVHAFPNTLSGGGTVSVDAGTYVITKTVTLTNRFVRVKGAGTNTVIDTRVPIGVHQAAFNFKTNHLEISSLKMTGANSPLNTDVKSPSLIACVNNDGGMNYLSVTNVTFDVMPEGHAQFISTDGHYSVNKVIIQDCHFNVGRTYPQGSSGFNNIIKIGVRARNVWVKNNTLVGESSLTGVGIGIWQCEDGIHIYDNVILDTWIGVAVSKSENGNYIGDPRYIYIDGNVIDNTLKDSVYLSGGRHIIVNENCLKNAGRNGVWVGRRWIIDEWDWPRDVMVSYNHITNTVADPIWVTALAVPETTLIGNDAAPCGQ